MQSWSLCNVTSNLCDTPLHLVVSASAMNHLESFLGQKSNYWITLEEVADIYGVYILQHKNQSGCLAYKNLIVEVMIINDKFKK